VKRRPVASRFGEREPTDIGAQARLGDPQAVLGSRRIISRKIGVTNAIGGAPLPRLIQRRWLRKGSRSRHIRR